MGNANWKQGIAKGVYNRSPAMRSVVFFLPLLLVTFLVRTVFAESSANVEINNDFNSTSVNSSSSINSKTDIRIESNGKVQEYHSDKPESVTLESEDGSVKINVNNSGSANVKSESTTSVKSNVDVSVNGVKITPTIIEKDGEKKVIVKTEETEDESPQEKATLISFITNILETIPIFSLFK